MPQAWANDLTARLGEWISPDLARLAVAGILVFVGYGVAHALRWVSARLLRGWSLRLRGLVGRVSSRHGVEAELAAGDAEDAAVRVTSGILFWLAFALFLAVATSTLGFPVLSTWLEGLARYLPRVFAAVLILLLGVVAGHVVRILVIVATRPSGFAQARSLARFAQVAVALAAAVVAVEALGIQATIVIVLVGTFVGAALGGVALAFGLGARTAVSNMIACHYLARLYRVGHRVRIGDREGTIAEFHPGGVVLETSDGRLYVPANEFAEKPSLLVTGKGEQ